MSDNPIDGIPSDVLEEMSHVIWNSVCDMLSNQEFTKNMPKKYQERILKALDYNIALEGTKLTVDLLFISFVVDVENQEDIQINMNLKNYLAAQDEE